LGFWVVWAAFVYKQNFSVEGAQEKSGEKTGPVTMEKTPNKRFTLDTRDRRRLFFKVFQSEEVSLAKNKSAEKRARKSLVANARNRSIQSRVRSVVKKVRSATSKDEAVKLLQEAVVVIDKAAQKGVVHVNNASRTKSRLFAAVAKIGKPQ